MVGTLKKFENTKEGYILIQSWPWGVEIFAVERLNSLPKIYYCQKVLAALVNGLTPKKENKMVIPARVPEKDLELV